MSAHKGRAKDKDKGLLLRRGPAHFMTASTGGISELGQRYASAFFDLAEEEGVLDAVESDVRALVDIIDNSDELRSFLANPTFDRDSQNSAMMALLDKADAHLLLKNLIQLVIKNGRLSALYGVLQAFLMRAAEARGEVSAEAITAAPLNDEQQQRLRAEIEASIGKAVNLTLSTDPDLLGGMIVKVGSRMVDSSLRTKLNRLKLAMKEA